MSLLDAWKAQGSKWMNDPWILKLVQSEQFMKAVMAAMSLPGKVEGITRETAERFARRMNLATMDQVDDLRRSVRALEEQVAELSRRK